VIYNICVYYVCVRLLFKLNIKTMTIVSRRHIIDSCDVCSGAPAECFRSVKTGFDCLICEQCYEIVEYFKKDKDIKKIKKKNKSNDSDKVNSGDLFN